MIDLAIDSRIYLSNTIDLALQELDILFNTVNTELIGYVDFGTNFEQFLWQLNPGTDELRRYIYQKIYNDTTYLRTLKVDIDINIEHSNYSPMFIVKIDITDESAGSNLTRIYNIK